MLTFAVQNQALNGNYWQLSLFNEVWGESVIVGYNVPIGEVITLAELPEGWSYPLYIDVLIYENLESPHNVIHRINSAYGPDWPDYLDITIPGDGDYIFDIATLLVPPTQDSSSVIGVVMLVGVFAMMIPMFKKGF